MKTADGKEIKDGDVVYVHCAPSCLAHCERVRYVDSVLMSEYAGTVFPGGVVDPGLVYSSASAAREAGKAGVEK